MESKPDKLSYDLIIAWHYGDGSRHRARGASGQCGLTILIIGQDQELVLHLFHLKSILLEAFFHNENGH